MTSTLSTALLWPLWRPGGHARDAASTCAALIPITHGDPYFVAPFVPGTGVEDRGHELRRIVGVPPNLLGAAATATAARLVSGPAPAARAGACGMMHCRSTGRPVSLRESMRCASQLHGVGSRSSETSALVPAGAAYGLVS